jgi:hypothetical protein
MLPGWLEQAIGVLLMLVILIDVFLTVLHARMGTEIVAGRVTRVTWRVFRRLADLGGRHHAAILSFGGPAILALIVATWAFGLTIGSALVIQPELGSSVRFSGGTTPTDFVTALYVGGSSLSVVGASEFAPQSSGSRLLFLLNSLVGMSAVALALTYLIQVSAGLHRRNALSLEVDLLSAQTGDAAELVARLGPQGQFTACYTNIAALATQMTGVAEAHRLYPVLFYFRFPDPAHSVPRMALVALDAVTLIEGALDDREYRWLKQSASVAHLWEVALALAMALGRGLAAAQAKPHVEPAPGSRKWTERFAAALRRLQRAGITVVADEEAGARTYAALRARWDGHVRSLALAMGYSQADVDPAGNGPSVVHELGLSTGRPEADPAFRVR